MANDTQWSGGEPPPIDPFAAGPSSTPSGAAPAAPIAYAPTFAPPAPAPRPSKNWMGITALVLGIVGGAVLAIVFGFLGLSAAKKGEATNRGQALAGVILGFVWFVVMVVGGIAVFISQANALDDTAPVQVAAGDCYDLPSVAYDDGTFGGVTLQDCSEPHSHQAFARLSLPDGDYPAASDSFYDVAFDRCTTDAALSRLDISATDYLSFDYIVPTSDAWRLGHRYLVCAVWDENGSLTESIVADA